MLQHHDRRLRFESLERREVMSATIFETEPNNTKRTADPVQFDVVDNAAELRGTVANRKDEDFYLYRPTSAGTVYLALSDSPTLAAKISVEDSAGQKLFESEPNDGVTSGSFNVAAGRNVYIRLRGQNKTTGDYTVQLSLNAPIAPPTTPPTSSPDGTASTLFTELESNDTKSTANRSDLGAALQIQGSATKRDNDFFLLRATDSGTVQIATTSGSVKLSVEDSVGNKLFESEPNDGVTGGSFAVTAGSTYYLRIRGTSTSVSPYLVDLAVFHDLGG